MHGNTLYIHKHLMRHLHPECTSQNSGSEVRHYAWQHTVHTQVMNSILCAIFIRSVLECSISCELLSGKIFNRKAEHQRIKGSN